MLSRKKKLYTVFETFLKASSGLTLLFLISAVLEADGLFAKQLGIYSQLLEFYEM